ncbi:MAG: hypothetical protein ACPGJS_21540 [Flammeovirgaceae bacterium]
MRKYLIFFLWTVNIVLRFWGIWFPQEGFDEGQNLQGAQLITKLFSGEFTPQIVTIYGFLGKVLSFIPYHVGNWLESYLPYSSDIPLGLVCMRMAISFLPNVFTIYMSLKLVKSLINHPSAPIITLCFYLLAFKHIETAHYAVNDSLCTFLAVWCMQQFIRYRETQQAKHLSYAGILAAFASAAKIHVGLLLGASIGLSFLVDLYLQNFRKTAVLANFRFILRFGLAFTLTFLVINLPYIIHLRLWVGEVLYHIRSYPFYYKGGLLTYFYFNPPYGIGVPTLVLAFIAIIIVLIKKEARKWETVMAFTALFIFFLASSRGAIHRWAIPLTPFLILLATKTGVAWIDWGTKKVGQVYSYLLSLLLIIGIGFLPFTHALKLADNLAQSPNTYDALNDFMKDIPRSSCAGRYYETAKLAFELAPLTEVSKEALDRNKINYVIFSDFYFPKDKPFEIGFSHIAKQLQLHEWYALREYIEREWELHQVISPKYYTPWSTNIGNPPPFYIYKRPSH